MPFVSLVKKGKIKQATGRLRGLMGKVGAISDGRALTGELE